MCSLSNHCPSKHRSWIYKQILARSNKKKKKQPIQLLISIKFFFFLFNQKRLQILCSKLNMFLKNMYEYMCNQSKMRVSNVLQQGEALMHLCSECGMLPTWIVLPLPELQLFLLSTLLLLLLLPATDIKPHLCQNTSEPCLQPPDSMSQIKWHHGLNLGYGLQVASPYSRIFNHRINISKCLKLYYLNWCYGLVLH